MSAADPAGRERRFYAFGWIFFLMSSIAYMATSFMAGDMVGLLGGFLFFLACVCFIIPFFSAK
jgi:hypothetical protein